MRSRPLVRLGGRPRFSGSRSTARLNEHAKPITLSREHTVICSKTFWVCASDREAVGLKMHDLCRNVARTSHFSWYQRKDADIENFSFDVSYWERVRSTIG